MRYNKILKDDFNNGKGIGITLFTQGCARHCKGCFNPETWDFDAGKEFTNKEIYKILELCDKEYINRFSILGGEPLLENNWEKLVLLIRLIRITHPEIKIWLWTGYTYEELLAWESPNKKYLDYILKKIDVMIDGPFIQEQQDIGLVYAGSRNQRAIDMPATIKNKKICLYK